MNKGRAAPAYSQRQLRVGELIKQGLGEIFIRNEAKILASFLINISPIFCLINSPTRNCL